MHQQFQKTLANLSMTQPGTTVVPQPNSIPTGITAVIDSGLLFFRSFGVATEHRELMSTNKKDIYKRIT